MRNRSRVARRFAQKTTGRGVACVVLCQPRMKKSLACLALALTSMFGCAADVDGEEEDEVIAQDAEALKRGKVIVGIADSEPDTFDQHWKDLGTKFARMVVPWNVALLPQDCEVRMKFRDYLVTAREAGARTVVMFGPDAGGDPRACPANGPRDRAPGLKVYREAMDAFTNQFSGQKILAAWNEPDYDNGPIVEDTKRPLHESPRRAADYYAELQETCRKCLLVAGEFASNPSSKEYWVRYKRQLNERNVPEPRVWGIHPTTDLILFAADASDAIDGRRGEGKRCTRNTMAGCVTKTFATWVATLPGRATVWLTETEAPVFRPKDPRLAKSFNGRSPERRENIQADAMRFLFDEIVKSHANVTRVFIYPLKERPNKQNDSGLVDGNRRREAYGVVRRYID